MPSSCKYRFSALVLIFSAWLGQGIGTADETEHASRGKTMDHVEFQLDFQPEGQHVPFAYGAVKGYYKAEGIDLSLKSGQGSQAAIDSVIKGKSGRFGQADANAVAVAVSQGIPIKMIATYLFSSPFGLVSFADKGIRTPQDLKGKRIGYAQSEAPRLLLGPFLRANGMSLHDITEVILSPKDKFAALKDGKVDLIGTNVASANSYEYLAKRPVAGIRYSAMGLPVPGDGIFVMTKYLQTPKDRDLACRMVRATSKAYLEAQKDPDGAAAALHHFFPNASFGKVELTAEAWRHTAQLTQTRKSLKTPPGYSFQQDWERLLGILKDVKTIGEIKPLSNYFTNDFVDCGAESSPPQS